MKTYSPEQLSQMFKQLPSVFTNEAVSVLDDTAKKSMKISQEYSPYRTGELQGSAIGRKAIVGKVGVKAGYLFQAPYAGYVEDMTWQVINTKFNSNARVPFGELGAEEGSENIMDDLSKALDKAWNKV